MNAYRACTGKEGFFLVFGLGIHGPQDEWDKGGASWCAWSMVGCAMGGWVRASR